MISHLDERFFRGELNSLRPDYYDFYLEMISDSDLVDRVEEDFLPLLDLIKKGVYHNLNPFEFPASIDWNKLYSTACRFFDNGEKSIAIVVSDNAKIGLKNLRGIGIENGNREEILIQYRSNTDNQEIVRLLRWEDLKRGNVKIW